MQGETQPLYIKIFLKRTSPSIIIIIITCTWIVASDTKPLFHINPFLKHCAGKYAQKYEKHISLDFDTDHGWSV